MRIGVPKETAEGERRVALVPEVVAKLVQAGHDVVERLENEIRLKLPHVEVLTHLEPLEDPRSWDDPEKPLTGS